jgi:HK97 family phage portal protein
MVFGRPSQWWARRLPRTLYRYERDVGDGMHSSVVMAPVLWIARTYPEAPLAVERDGEIERDHPMAQLIRNPNPFYSGHLLEMATLINLVLNGNAYWLKVRNRMRGPVQLWYVPYWMMQPKAPDDGSAYISHYAYSPLGVPIRVEVEDVVHLRYGIDPQNIRQGLGLLTPLLREIFTDDEAAAFTASLLRNAGVPGLVVSPASESATVSETDKKDVKEYLKQAFSGDARGEPLVMTGPTRVEQFGFDPQKLDLARLREIPEERVCAMLGMPAAVVGFGSGLAQTKVGATMSEMREMAYESCIIPLQRLVAAELDRQLLPDFEPRPETCRTIYDLSEVRVLQEDQNRLALRWDTMIRGGWVEVAEGRQAMRLEVKPEHHIYLRPFSALVVPAGRTPQQQAAESEGVRDEEPAGGNGKERPWMLAPVKSSASDRQAFARRQLRERRKLSSAFGSELTATFRGLGEQVADLWADALRSTFPGARGADLPALKELSSEQIALLVQRVMGHLDLSGFDFGPHYIRTTVSTLTGINSAFGLGVNLSEPLEAKIISEGGRRLGLLDMSGQAMQSMFDAIADARELGHGPAEIALDLRDTIPRGPWSTPDIRAEVIARTETMHAQNYASLEAYRASDTVTMLQVVDGQLGDRSCQPCIDRDGQVVTFEEADRIAADEHPNGTLSFTPVVGRPKAEEAPEVKQPAVVNVHVGQDGKIVGMTGDGRRKARKRLRVIRDEQGNLEGADIVEEWTDGE